MFIHYRSQGIILKKENLREVDQLFTIYTKDFGKLEVLGKAIRKIKSKLRGGAELFYLSEIEFIQGKTHKILTDAILIDNFKNLRKDLKRLAIAYKISEVLDDLIRGEEPDEELWCLITETFQSLNTYNLKPKTYRLIYYYFLWNFLSILGYQPELYHCAICQKRLAPKIFYFSLEQGGVICDHCARKIRETEKIDSYPKRVPTPKFGGKGRAPSVEGAKIDELSAHYGVRIEPEVIKILRIILKKDWDTLLRLKIEDPYRKSLRIISELSLSYIGSILSKNQRP